MGTSSQPVGTLLREWRQRRHLSQLDLACDADISTRHLSFVETGRSQPSREMIVHLSERLDIPLRERNSLLITAGFAPLYQERTLQHASLESARRAIDIVLTGHEPYPALAVDRQWTLLASNQALLRLLAGVAPSLLQAPVNVLRVALHPEGLASRILNFELWQAHLVTRLRRQIEVTGDRVLVDLLHELKSYTPSRSAPPRDETYAGVVVPLELVFEQEVLRLFSATTVFGTAVEVTLSEVALESFFPADDATAAVLRAMAGR